MISRRAGRTLACARLVLGGVLAILFSACGEKKQDPVAELEKTAAAMRQTPAEESPAPASSSAKAAPPAPSRQVQEALADYQAGKMEDAVTRLQMLRSLPNLTPEQRMALQDSIAAVMQEVYALAEKGDPRAAAAIARYQQMQHRSR